ncbi:MAG: hypothetical protein NT162_03655, partial [Candidatus Woesebacteria bacterium]|nr:hypothetical protein [Candidatus Woesebacteria bacterium]
ENREVVSEDVQNAIRDIIPLSKTMAEKMQSLREWAKGRARCASPESSNKTAKGQSKDFLNTKSFGLTDPPPSNMADWN